MNRREIDNSFDSVTGRREAKDHLKDVGHVLGMLVRDRTPISNRHKESLIDIF
jgi:hypothetical protein